MSEETSNEGNPVQLDSETFPELLKETGHRIIAAMVDGVTIVGLNGEILDCNDAILRLHGVSRNEFVGKHVYDFVHPDDRQRAIQEASQVLEKGWLRIEVKALRKGGETFDAEGHISLLRDDLGKPLALLGVTRDITEWNKKREAIRESEANFRSIFENAGDCMIYLDATGRILDVNGKAVEVFGGLKEELLGKHFTRVGVVSPKNIPSLVRAFASGFAGKHPKLSIGIRNRKGKEVALECLGSLARRDDSPALLVVARDVTERKMIEEKYRKQFEEALDAIFLADAETGILLDCNRAAAELVNREKSELIGRHQRILHPSEEAEGEFSRTFKQHLEEREGQVLETQVVTKDGEVKDVAIKANVFGLGSRRIIQGIFRDITERKKAEQAIQESQQKFERLFRSNPEAAAYCDPRFRVLDINPRFSELFGYSLDEVRGKQLDETIVPQDKMEESQFLGRKSKEGYVYHDTVRMRKDKSVVPVSISVAPIAVEGQLIGYAVLYKDISKRKQAEEALRESEEKYRTLVENTKDSIVIVDLKGNVLFGNRATEELTGYALENGVGMNVRQVTPLKYWPKSLAMLLKAKQGKRVPYFESEIRRKDGALVPVESGGQAVFKNGKVVGVQIITRDITERKEMEKKLKQYSGFLEELVQKRTEELLESEGRYSILAEETGHGIVIIQDDKIVFANNEFSKIFSYPLNEIIGLDVTQLLEKLVTKEYHQTIEEMREQRLQGKVVLSAHEVEMVTKTGEKIHVERSGALVRYQGRPAVLYILRDISERKRMEEQHLRLEKLATMGELATMVAHDLRNPLASIRNACFYIKNTCPARADAECEDSLEMLEIVEKETLAASNIINDLLDFAAERPLQKKKHNMNSLIDDSLKSIFIPENISVERKYAGKVTAAVDEKQLERVFSNLTKNAIQAMPNGGTLTVATSETRGHIEMAFTDTGTGIPEDNMNKLFTPLFTTKAKGIGMGLAICKKILEQHGGTIEAQSKTDQGTTFTIKLPKNKEANIQ